MRRRKLIFQAGYPSYMIMEFDAATVIALALAVLLLIVNHMRNGNNKHRAYPPHPPSWPIIGHLHLLIKNKELPIHRILSSLSQRYGPIMHLQLGCRPNLVISSSSLAKECFTTNDRVFASRPRSSAADHMSYGYKLLVYAPYSSSVRNIRKLCMLQLFSAHRMESFKHIRAEEISSLISSLYESCQQQPSTVNMKSKLAELTFNIVVRMVASKKTTGDSQGAQHFKEVIKESFYLAGAFNVGDYLPFLKWLDLQGLQAAAKKLQKKRDGFMQMLVNQHRVAPDLETEDFIDVLLSETENHGILSDDDNDNTVVKATALSMINAGTDTTAVTLEWSLAALLQNPHILRKAQLELDTHIGRDRIIGESDLHKLKYLEAIVKETLRLYPATAIIPPHESTEACSVGGYHVPAGTRLLVNAWAIHRDPAVWDRPTEFDPERFLKSEEEIEMDVKGHNFELIPFGSGRRKCPGMSLALRVVWYTLARLLQSFEWSVGVGNKIDMKEGFGLTMPKAVPLEALIQPRLPPHLY